MKMKKVVAPGNNAWPVGLRCALCPGKIARNDTVLAGREPTQGSVVFHKGCIVALVGSEWPETLYDGIRKSIIESPESVLA